VRGHDRGCCGCGRWRRCSSSKSRRLRGWRHCRRAGRGSRRSRGRLHRWRHNGGPGGRHGRARGQHLRRHERLLGGLRRDDLGVIASGPRKDVQPAQDEQHTEDDGQPCCPGEERCASGRAARHRTVSRAGDARASGPVASCSVATRDGTCLLSHQTTAFRPGGRCRRVVGLATGPAPAPVRHAAAARTSASPAARPRRSGCSRRPSCAVADRGMSRRRRLPRPVAQPRDPAGRPDQGRHKRAAPESLTGARSRRAIGRSLGPSVRRQDRLPIDGQPDDRQEQRQHHHRPHQGLPPLAVARSVHHGIFLHGSTGSACRWCNTTRCCPNSGSIVSGTVYAASAHTRPSALEASSIHDHVERRRGRVQAVAGGHTRPARQARRLVRSDRGQEHAG